MNAWKWGAFSGCACVLEDFDRKEEALQALDNAAEILPDDYSSHESIHKCIHDAPHIVRGRILEKLGYYKEALQAYDRAIELCSYYEVAKKHRSKLSKRMGRRLKDGA